MRLALLALSFLLMFAMAFVTAFRRTIWAVGLRRAETALGGGRVDWRCRILLEIYVKKLNLVFLLGIVVYLVTARTSHWYYGVGIVGLCWFGSRLLPPVQWLRTGSEAILGLLLVDLEHRRQRYQVAADSNRLYAIDDLLHQIRSQHWPSRLR
jgi:hypothetical protein